MNLEDFKLLINSIPAIYDDTEVSFICNGKAYTITEDSCIEYYEDDMNDNKKMVDITIN